MFQRSEIDLMDRPGGENFGISQVNWAILSHSIVKKLFHNIRKSMEHREGTQYGSI